jgi:hypothetical protein
MQTNKQPPGDTHHPLHLLGCSCCKGLHHQVHASRLLQLTRRTVVGAAAAGTVSQGHKLWRLPAALHTYVAGCVLLLLLLLLVWVLSFLLWLLLLLDPLLQPLLLLDLLLHLVLLTLVVTT